MHSTIRGCLKDLIEVNSKSSEMWIKEEGMSRDATLDDVKEFNRDRLFALADMLGMSDLYLEDKEKERKQK